MGPILLIDKSTIQGLNPDEVRTLTRYYSPVVCPIFMRELLSNLAKVEKDRVETERKLSALAAKVDMPGFYVVADASSMAVGNLMGHDVPMDGRVPTPGGVTVRAKDGTRGLFFDESEEAKILRRWQANQFSLDEKVLAQLVRAMDLSVDLQAVRELVATQLSHFPTFNSLAELVGWIDDTYLSLTDQRSHITIAGQSLLSASDVQLALNRWENEGKPLFANFAPYSYYFYRCNVIYFLGLAKGFISASRKGKTHLDLHYLYYLPFCMAFTSGDTFLRDLFPFFKRINQKFLWKDHLKVDLKNIGIHWDGLDDAKKKEFRAEYENYPPDLPGSITATTWRELMRPMPSKEERLPELSKERERLLVEEIISHSRGAVGIEDNKSIDPTYTARYENVGLKERSSMLRKKCAEIVGLEKGKAWSDVQKEFSAEHVKAIYNWYADLWRPDTDLKRIMAPSPTTFRVLYLGEIDPDILVKNALGSLLYFDQICIVDPFINPWAIKEEMNPIKHPHQYEGDLLKLVYILTLLSPWIETEQIAFVPDPSDFNAKFKWDVLKVAEKKRQRELTPEENQELEQMQERGKEIFFRYIRRLPEEAQRHMLKQSSPELSAEDADAFIKFTLRERARDPIAVDRTFTEKDKKGYLTMVRSGAGFEMSLIICRLLGAVPLTPLNIRMNDYIRAKRSPADRWKLFCELFNTSKLRFLYHVDPSLVLSLKECGYLSRFRKYFTDLASRLNSGIPISDGEMAALTTELERTLHHTHSEWDKIENMIEQSEENPMVFGVLQGHLVLDIEEEGYTSNEVEELCSTYVQNPDLCQKVRLAFRLVHDSPVTDTGI